MLEAAQVLQRVGRAHFCIVEQPVVHLHVGQGDKQRAVLGKDFEGPPAMVQSGLQVVQGHARLGRHRVREARQP